MSKQIQVRRDTKTNLLTVVPALAEMAYNTTDGRLHMGDGSTAGGIPHATYKDIIDDYFRYGTVGGSANAITLTVPYAPPSLKAGQEFKFKPTSSNTGSTTVAVNGGSAKTIYKLKGGLLVTLASGDLITGNIYKIIYDGTNFQLYGYEQTVAGAAAVLLGTATASASSTIDFTGLITSTYAHYFWLIDDLRPSAASQLWLRTSTDGGVTFDATSGNYGSYMDYQCLNTTTPNGNNTGTTTRIEVVPSTVNIGNGAAAGLSGRVDLFSPLGTARNKQLTWATTYQDASANDIWCRGSGTRRATADIDSLRFMFSTGNATSGKIRMYGITA